jgi:hypothetical protein
MDQANREGGVMRSVTLTADLLRRLEPDESLPAVGEFEQRYQNLIQYGHTVSRRSSCLFIGLARDVGPILGLNAQRIEHMASWFDKSAVLIIENDSTDGTKEALAEWSKKNATVHFRSFDNGRPHLVGFEPDRVTALAEYREMAKEIAKAEYSEFDLVCVLDTDIWGGYSGLLTGVAWHDRVPEAGGLASVSAWEAEKGLFAHYDQWAFRRYGWETRFEPYFNYWIPPAGSEIIPVRSAFGGMCIYKMKAFLSGQYAGGDCEHVTFHRSIARWGWKMFLNPSQRVVMLSQATEDGEKEESKA